MIPFTPQFLKFLNPEKQYDHDIHVAKLIKKFEYMMSTNRKNKTFYFKIPKEYNCVRKQFLENIVNNLEKEGFKYDYDNTNKKTYLFFTSFLKYTKLVKEDPKLVKECNYESPLYIEYGSLEDAIGIQVCV